MNPITRTPRRRAAGQSSPPGLLHPPALLRAPFPVKSPALSACVSPQTIHFRVLDRSPLSGPERGPASCNSLNSRNAFGDWTSEIRGQQGWLLLTAVRKGPTLPFLPGCRGATFPPWLLTWLFSVWICLQASPFSPVRLD